MAKNTPLTNEQKLKIMSAQRRLMARQLSQRGELKALETAFQQELSAVVQANDLNFDEVYLNDDLDIIEKPKAGAPKE